jgi:hypothetical protein
VRYTCFIHAVTPPSAGSACTCCWSRPCADRHADADPFTNTRHIEYYARLVGECQPDGDEELP